MAKAFIPKVSSKLVDLEPYGGKGHLRIKGMSIGVSQGLTTTLQDLAKKDGYDLSQIDRHQKEIDVRYTIPMMNYIVLNCTEIEEEDGTYRPITSDEMNDMPTYLISDLSVQIQELNKFPLVQQKNGEVSKKEQPKPTEEA